LASNESGPADQPAAPGADTFATVVEVHWTAVYKLVYSLTGNTHDTEDLTQETFLRALNRLDSFRPGTNMRSWLLRIASNAFFDWQRKCKRARVKPLEHDPPGAAQPAGHALEVAEQSKLLEVALAELSDKTRLVFHLRAQEGLSFREIAQLVGTTEQAARWFMHQARTKLLKQLGPEL
jgi:RNA polymerase sigma-70 factor (ECF subfamily)